ncbi:hypothetical protein RYZ59_01785 [Citrobacter sp. HN-141]|uniref:hypothetical protein n=1 Tax=unclassified Citrobacter TaxID=2644389 RepID=UPI002964A501|nr:MULTISPECIES: hypothetical protein [unclassified Citrobacter]MDW2642328.1 hypothetical protein [Citrobacter sp. HN-141]MDW2651675.1 hypothetical protein [Citrobacter sp. HN-120]MDW2694700.1 hypothetical protein [Citrobacter sp. HN-144]
MADNVEVVTAAELARRNEAEIERGYQESQRNKRERAELEISERLARERAPYETDVRLAEALGMGPLGDLRYGKVTTRFKYLSFNGDPYHEVYTCVYPNGGAWVLYMAENPRNYQYVGTDMGSAETCESVAWRTESNSLGHYSVSRRFDSAAAWSAHWKHLNKAVFSGISAVGDFIREQPIIDALIVLIIGALVWRWRKNKGKK